MPVDELIEPKPVTIELWNPGVQIEAKGTKSPMAGKRGTQEVVIPAQVYWGTSEDLQMRQEAVDEHWLGAVVVRFIDVPAGVVFKRGDRIIRIGTKPRNLFVTHKLEFGHWADLDDAAYLKLFFSDRRPVQESM